MIRLHAVLLLGLALASFAAAQPYGIASRTPNTTLLIEDMGPAGPGGMQVERVFPRLTFNLPLFISEMADSTGRMIVMEKEGRILTFPKSGDPGPGDTAVFLDLSPHTASEGEQGLLGLAFDPDFAQNGIFYLSYSWNGGGSQYGATRLSRFSAAGGGAADAQSEQVLLELPKAWPVHCGGMLGFGADGMLYMSFGDDVAPGAPRIHGQDTTQLYGSIVRLDVRGPADPGSAYRIPADNPFYFGGPAGEGTRREIFAYGFRNPWRFSFEPATGRLICGDVGEGTWEEINLIAPGGNFGWPAMEGAACTEAVLCDTTGMTPPLFTYHHEGGGSVIGGCVYEGSAVPELQGVYLFGDFSMGRIWGMDLGSAEEKPATAIVEASGLYMTSFGKDLAGEVYFTDVVGGIHVLRPAPVPAENFPTRLSDIPALLAAGLGQDQSNAGIIPYAPAAGLWSDGAIKQRFIALPGAAQIGWTATDGWTFPDKTVLIKNFSTPADERDPEATARRVETRLLYRRRGQWNGFSYEWNDAGTDATLLDQAKVKNIDIIDRNGQSESISYLFPSRAQCLRCHNPATGGALGLTTPQLNNPLLYSGSGVEDNQLRTMNHLGMFSEPLPADPGALGAMPGYHDANATTRDRARAYLASNCSMCHRPGGGPASYLDLRWETADGNMNAIDALPSRGDLGIAGGRLIARRDPARSILLERDRRRDGSTQMPPLASSRVDADAIALLEAYIQSLESVNAAPPEAWMIYH